MSTKLDTGDLQDALDSVQSTDSHAFDVGYISTPQSVTWVRRSGRQLLSPTGPLDLDWVYEARLFSATGELRWKWSQDHGRWSIIDDATATTHGWSVLREHSRQRVRLLRGTARDAGAQGWTSLWDGQAAPFEIPLELARGEGALITAVEYVQQDPTHGTVDVVAERFTGLQAWMGTRE